MDIETTTLFITEAHSGQYDKLGVPYVEHPKAVATILSISPSFYALNSDDRQTAMIAALLHDVIEDTKYSAKDLINLGYETDVVDVVELLTYDSKKESRLDYYNRIMGSSIARAVKVADVIHNSLPSRLSHLDSDVRARLKTKYDKAREVLFNEDDNMFFIIKTYN
jgi:(p)ppGpp synthase/HD superfamily hydrolase